MTTAEAMKKLEFDAAWRNANEEERAAWLGRELLGLNALPHTDGFYYVWEGAGAPTPPQLERSPAFEPDRHVSVAAVEDAIERRGLQEQYALTLAELVEEPHQYGQQSRGIKFWRLAHASAEQRCRAALMTVLGVES